MIMEKLGGMQSSLPAAPYDYCQDHESAPNNVVVNAVIAHAMQVIFCSCNLAFGKPIASAKTAKTE